MAELASDEDGDSGSSASSSGPLVVLRGSAARLEGFRECVAMTDESARSGVDSATLSDGMAGDRENASSSLPAERCGEIASPNSEPRQGWRGTRECKLCSEQRVLSHSRSRSTSILALYISSSVIADDIMAPKKDKYSVILPTYNERQNLPVLVQMLYDVFTKE
jgi:hypothetical protein